jgi:hypothetical protein
MPGCPSCHNAAITAVQSASVVRDLGALGAISAAAAATLGIRRRATRLRRTPSALGGRLPSARGTHSAPGSEPSTPATDRG